MSEDAKQDADQDLSGEKLYAYFSPDASRLLMRHGTAYSRYSADGASKGPMLEEPPRSGSIYMGVDGVEVLATELSRDPAKHSGGWHDAVALGEVSHFVRAGKFEDIPKEHGVEPAEPEDVVYHVSHGKPRSARLSVRVAEAADPEADVFRAADGSHIAQKQASRRSNVENASGRPETPSVRKVGK